jgi:hypothetical protein
MKPSWDNAPAWANYLAQDDSGHWCWYEITPVWVQEDRMWQNQSGSRWDWADEHLVSGANTLERRP